MTDIRYEEDGRHVRLTLNGHAQYADTNDIVCAGISTLTYTLGNYLDDAADRGRIMGLLFRDTPGDMVIEFDTVDPEEWQEIKRLILTGYEMLSEHFPDNVKVGHIVR